MTYFTLEGRKIYVSDRGAYFTRNSEGKRMYGIKAAFKQDTGQPRVRITHVTAKSVPCPIRPTLKKPTVSTVNDFMKGMTTTSANLRKLKRLNAN